MRKNYPTSVILYEHAEAIRRKYVPAFGLKNILSVGLELFDELSDKEKIQRITKVAHIDNTAKKIIENVAANAEKDKKRIQSRRIPTESA
jgi:hypothetical protein